jgi:hypothetical protein
LFYKTESLQINPSTSSQEIFKKLRPHIKERRVSSTNGAGKIG